MASPASVDFESNYARSVEAVLVSAAGVLMLVSVVVLVGSLST